MEYLEKFELISQKLKISSIPPHILMSKLRFIEEQSRYSRACLDPHYIPFYFYLGANWPVKSLLEIGFGLGLNASVYFMGCPTVENYLTIQEPPDVYYSARMGRANIKQVWRRSFYSHVGKVHDEVFVDKMRQRKWDLVLINEKSNYDTYLLWLNTVWDVVKEDGLICMEYTTLYEQAKRAYADFCVIKNRDQYVFNTRYGVGTLIR